MLDKAIQIDSKLGQHHRDGYIFHIVFFHPLPLLNSTLKKARYMLEFCIVAAARIFFQLVTIKLK